MRRRNETTGNPVIKLVRKYQDDLEEFGSIRFEIRLNPGTKDTKFAALNEQQSSLILTYMRNSDINEFRKKKAEEAGVKFPSKGFAELRHDSFMLKVIEVIGAEGSQNFLDTYIHHQNGQKYQMYRFPKREACLMAMSYSYELQAQVFGVSARPSVMATQNRPACIKKSYMVVT